MEKGLYSFGTFITSRICLQVPEYQRHYAWDEKQWDDLWNDLYYLETGRTHYFGTIILMEKVIHEEMPELWFDRLEIVDGQQRIATILILMREVIAQLEEGRGLPSKHIRKLREDYLRYESVYKLELLGDDREFFRRYIIEGEEPFEITTLSQDRLKRARRFFMKKLEEVKTRLSSEEFKKFLTQLRRKIDMMELMVYPIKETTEAARMFELVNDRGKDLTNLEKTKSYLMYMVYLTAPIKEQERYLRDLNDSFGNIFKSIMEIQSSKYGRDIKEDDVQRYHFITYATKDMLLIPPELKYPWTRMEAAPQYMQILKSYVMRMYRTNKKKCLDTILDYAKDLENAFFVLKDIFQYNRNDELGNCLERLFLLGRVANFYPLLMAYWMRSKKEKGTLKEILRLIEVMTFRIYAIGRRRADAGRSTLYDLAYGIHRGSISYAELIKTLKSLVQDYEWTGRFEEHLRSKDFYDRVIKNDIRYLLYEYESFLRKEQGERLEFTLGEILSRDKWGKPNYEIEHIWPRDPSKLGLNEEELKEHEQCVDRLGNLTLASKGWNKRMSNKSFDKKCEEYKNSGFKIQRILQSYTAWGKKQIRQREEKLVNFALRHWKI